MRLPAPHLALVLALTFPAAAAADDERLHVEFEGRMPALVQTVSSGGRDVDESSAQEYARKVSRNEPVGVLAGYAVKPAPTGCDKPGLPCPSRRDALPDDRADDLPAGFNIEISDDPAGEDGRRALRSAAVHGSGPWVVPGVGQAPFTSNGAGTVHVLASQAGKLRPGALAQAECYDVMKLCSVRMTYSRDLRVNFLTPASGEALARQVMAVDAFMQSVIRPGPLPPPGTGLKARRSPWPDVPRYEFQGLPLGRIQAAFPNR